MKNHARKGSKGGGWGKDINCDLSPNQNLEENQFLNLVPLPLLTLNLLVSRASSVDNILRKDLFGNYVKAVCKSFLIVFLMFNGF